MFNLDDIKKIKKQDPLNVLGSIEQLGGQCEQAWQEVSKIALPQDYTQVNKIVFSGMGGSALGAYVVKDLFFQELKIPFEIVNDYQLPSFVDKNTLVILASYSGTTEETLSCAQQLIQKKLKGFILTTNGQLANIAKSYRLPAYIFLPKHNPSRQPRLGTGYSIFSQLALFHKLKLLKISPAVVSVVVKQLKQGNQDYGVWQKTEKNLAKKWALAFKEKILVVVAAQHLTGVGRVIRNQLHETAKSYADYYPLPELNHHLMEGLSFPKQNPQVLVFLFLVSNLYSARILKRFTITQEVVKKNQLKVYLYQPNHQSKVVQALVSIQFGAYLSYYLAILNQVDPSQIPWVDYFKKKLGK